MISNYTKSLSQFLVVLRIFFFSVSQDILVQKKSRQRRSKDPLCLLALLLFQRGKICSLDFLGLRSNARCIIPHCVERQ